MADRLLRPVLLLFWALWLTVVTASNATNAWRAFTALGVSWLVTRLRGAS